MNEFEFTIHTDKAPGGWHSAYCTALARMFRPLKEKAKLVAEIGVDGFGFTSTLANYFQSATIVALDIRDIPKPTGLPSNIDFRVRDAYCRATVQELAPMGLFDVLNEDGIHSLPSQEFFIQHYPHLLTEDGIAIIEDIQAPEHVAHLCRMAPEGFFAYGIDLTMHDGGRYDNRLIIVHRK